MASQVYEPGNQNDPYGNVDANPQGSNYADYSAFSADETILIEKAVKRTLFDAAPQQYNALKLLYQKPPEDRPLDEFEYLEKTFSRDVMESTSGSTPSGVISGSPQSNVTHSFDVTNASLNNISKDLIIIYPDNTKGTITDISGNTITVHSLTGSGLPDVSSGDIFSIQSTIYGDGLDYFAHYSRLEHTTRYNYIQFFLRAKRWAERELIKYRNQGRTDYLNHDRMDKIKQLRVDLFNSFWNGERGEYQLQNGGYAKSMGGVYPLMQNAGAPSANPTISGLPSAFETLAFESNFKQEGETRFVFGTDKMLFELMKAYKQPGLRYEPNDEVANLNLSVIEIGTMRFVLVSCELFKEESCFPASWARRLICLDMESIQPVKLQGLPAMEAGGTLDLQDGGTREGYKDWWCRAQLGLEFHNPLGCFSIDVQ